MCLRPRRTPSSSGASGSAAAAGAAAGGCTRIWHLCLCRRLENTLRRRRLLKAGREPLCGEAMQGSIRCRSQCR